MSIFFRDSVFPEDVAAGSPEAEKRASRILELITPKTPNVELKRLGSNRDGGYVVLDDFAISDSLLSFGIENNIDIENDISHSVKEVHMYDGTIDGLPYEISNGVFFKEMLGETDDANTATLSKTISRVSGDNIIIKCDIEGAEWKLFKNCNINDLKRVKQIIIELHWLDKITSNIFYFVAKSALENIYSTHYPVNVHENNHQPALQFGDVRIPRVLEITYANRELYSFTDYDSSNYDKLNSSNFDWLDDLIWDKPWK